MRTKSLLILSSLFLVACESKPEARKEETIPIPVLAVTPQVKNIPIYIEAIGTLQPAIYMEVHPEISGTLMGVMVKEGQWVEEGTPLFHIDPSHYEIKVQEAEAQVAMDQASLLLVEKKQNRFQQLVKKDLLAKAEWDEIEAQVAKAQASLRLDEARLNAARIYLKQCTMKAPISGRLGKLDANPGLSVSSGQKIPLATISKMDPLIVEFFVTESEFPSLLRGYMEIQVASDLSQSIGDELAIEITPLSSSEAHYHGKISFLDNHFDARTGLILVRGKIPNPDFAIRRCLEIQDASLRPGQSVRVRIPIAIMSNAKLIPQKAVRFNQQGPFIYVVQKDNTVGFRQLLLGKEEGLDVIVLEGLDLSEPVITDGHLRLAPGLKVEIK